MFHWCRGGQARTHAVTDTKTVFVLFVLARQAARVCLRDQRGFSVLDGCILRPSVWGRPRLRSVRFFGGIYLHNARQFMQLVRLDWLASAELFPPLVLLSTASVALVFYFVMQCYMLSAPCDAGPAWHGLKTAPAWCKSVGCCRPDATQQGLLIPAYAPAEQRLLLSVAATLKHGRLLCLDILKCCRALQRALVDLFHSCQHPWQVSQVLSSKPFCTSLQA